VGLHKQGTRICLPVRQAGVPYELSRSLSYLFYRFKKFVGGFSLLGHIHLVGVRKQDSLGIAEGDALGISVTVITFHRHLFCDIKEGMAERAGHDASLASDAQVFVDDDSVIEFRLSVAGLGRAHFNAIGLFAVIADHGKVDSRMFPFEHFTSGTAWITRPGMKDRAYQFALTAPRALLLIDD
jgi:hypothetical protein